MDKPYDIQERAFLFACCIVDFCRPLVLGHPVMRELSRQLLASGTSVGANLEEADAGQSKPDFRSKVSISRKEAYETRFWLRLLVHADRRLIPNAAPLLQESTELIAILTTIKKNSESNDGRG
jgi:four helix bundle protein